MADQKPPDWFDRQETRQDDAADFKRRKAQLLEQLPKLLARQRDRGRANSCYPYLLVRSVLGDRGDRPFNACFWESPDIWTAQGDPANTPAIPPDHGGKVTAGQPSTVYAHVWNLGFAPLAGIHVEFYWFNPTLGITGAHANLIGMARCELAARGMPGSHKLVKCPQKWIPVMENGGHECLVVRVWGIGDPLGANDWHPWQNRHVAQRNISVVSAGANIVNLVSTLNASRLFNTRVQLIQVGAREGELARHIVAPKVRLAAIDTHVLGEISITNEVVLPAAGTHLPPGALAPIHPLAAGGLGAPPAVRPMAPTRIIDPRVMLGTVRPAARPATTHLSDLLTGVAALHPGTGVHEQPAANEAHVVRLASYSGDQLVGGYTLVVTGR